MTTEITENDLKIKGVSLLEDVISQNESAVITVSGKEKYIVLRIEDYHKLREWELEAAIQESRNDITNGKFHSGKIEEHLKRVANV